MKGENQCKTSEEINSINYIPKVGVISSNFVYLIIVLLLTNSFSCVQKLEDVPKFDVIITKGRWVTKYNILATLLDSKGQVIFANMSSGHELHFRPRIEKYKDYKMQLWIDETVSDVNQPPYLKFATVILQINESKTTIRTSTEAIGELTISLFNQFLETSYQLVAFSPKKSALNIYPGKHFKLENQNNISR